MSLRPLEVDGRNIERLGVGFVPFVNLLLQAETARIHLSPDKVMLTTREDDPDGGADAAVEDAEGSEWFPDGLSAWQFKRSDLDPAGCRQAVQEPEIRAILERGGSFCLAIGADLTPQKLRNRKAALVDEVGDEQRVRLYNASHLASWANELPSVLTFPPLEAISGPFISHEEWSKKLIHRFLWVADDERTRLIEDIRIRLVGAEEVFFRVEGPGGVGKTRLVLEALRDERLQPITIYVDQASELDGAQFNNLQRQRRAAIVVADECDRRMHRRLTDRIESGSSLKLLTIGLEEEAGPEIHQFYALHEMDREPLEEVLQRSFPDLPAAHRSFVATVCEGSVRLGLLLSERIQGLPEADAAAIVSRGDVEGLLQLTIPTGPERVTLAFLSLMRRCGWDESKGEESVALAKFAGKSDEEFRGDEVALRRAGLTAQQGRYRYVTPHPLALVMASELWQSRGREIVEQLLPALGAEGKSALLGRAADLGRYPPAQRALESLFQPEGPFGSLGELERDQRAQLLNYLAVIDPSATTSTLERLLGSHSIDDLRTFTESRRQLVWSLEKLAWHRSIFERAANLLLRLALAENESYSNNATGVWAALFGVRLPATAATPEQRLDYLESLTSMDHGDTRRMVVNALRVSLSGQESRVVSAERQYGVAVEEPGVPATFEEELNHRLGLLRLYVKLLRDPDPGVAQEAASTLEQLIRSLLWIGLNEHAFELLSSTPPSLLKRARNEVKDWLRLHEDAPQHLRSRLSEFLADTVPDDPMDELREAGLLSTWEYERLQDETSMLRALERLVQANRLDELIQWVSSDKVPAAWNLGKALGNLENFGDYLELVVELPNVAVLFIAGYLDSQLAKLGEEWFQELLDRLVAQDRLLDSIPLLTSLAPASREAVMRLKDLLASGKIAPGSLARVGLVPWARELSPNEIEPLLREWFEGSAEAADYDSLIDLVDFYVKEKPDAVEELQALLWRLVESLPHLSGQGVSTFTWKEIATRVIESDPVRLALIVLDYIETAGPTIASHPEAEVLGEAARLSPEGVWALIVERLDSYRLIVSIRGWLVYSFPVSLITEWIGTDIDRARTVSSIAPAGGSQPSELAYFLLDRFPEDSDIHAHLWGEFASGVWSGPESRHIEGQIESLQNWLNVPSAGVRSWAQKMISSLEDRLAEARREEEERGW